MHNAIYVTDPASGDRVMLSELARRHSIHVSTLSRRYADGKRGESLLEKIDHNAHLAEQNAKRTEEVERRQAILSASAFGLRRPLNLIGNASKIAGGAP